MISVILAGGFGTRLAEETEVRPKPMVEIGGRPVLWHILKHYAHHGFNDFALALGYKGEMIKRYFLDYAHLNSDFTVHLGSGDFLRRDICCEKWVLHLTDTGLHTMTGGRIKRLAKLIGRETFMLTYGDGLSDVNLIDLVRFHRRHGKLATVTAVRPPARYGSLVFDSQRDQPGQVVKFAEKAQVAEGWINGGFFVLEPQVLDYIDGDATYWERDPLERLTADGQLMAYAHDGFWQAMDTIRDVKYLEGLWNSGKAPWKMWN